MNLVEEVLLLFCFPLDSNIKIKIYLTYYSSFYFYAIHFASFKMLHFWYLMKSSFFQYTVHKDGKLSSNIFYIDASTTVFKLKTLIFSVVI